MNIVFFDLQEWEKETLKNCFPNATFVTEKLTSENASSYSSAEIISTFIYSTVTKEVLDKMTSLKCIVTRSTGFDHIDVEYCKQKNISVCNVPEYGSNTVAEHTFALILSLTRKLYQSVSQCKNLNFEHDAIRGIDLFGKTLGIIGMGKIGEHIVRIANGFQMKVLVYTRTQDEELIKKYGIQYVELDTLLSNSDVITLHLPLTPKTQHIINKENITKFKKGSYIINTARGGLIETEALILGLDQGMLEGVGLDVLEEEKELSEEAAILTSHFRENVDLKTLVYDHMLINHPKVLITPHNAFNSQEALCRILDVTCENISAFEQGKVMNTINGKQ